jgi:hypothetical protein
VQFNGTAPVPSEARNSIYVSNEVQVGCDANVDIVRVQRVIDSPALLEVMISTQPCYIGELVFLWGFSCGSSQTAVQKVQSAAEIRGVGPVAISR